MINIFTSNTSNGANELIISEIGNNNVPNSYHIVFCPSNYGFSIEKQIYEQLGLKGTFNIEVTSFTRYSYKNLPSTLPTLTKEGGILLTKKIIMKNRDKLRHFKKMTDNVNFAGLMSRTIRQLRQNGYDSLFLRTKGKEIEGATGDKLQDIALIMEEFNGEVATGYIDNIIRLELLAENIKKKEKSKNTHVYFLGFEYFSSQELGMLKAFGQNAISVNVGIVSAGAGAPNEGYFQNRILNQITNLELEGIEIGKEVKGYEILKGTSQILHNEMLGYREHKQPLPPTSNVVLYKENNVYEEINGVAHEIVKLVRREGYRYKDINIVCCAPEYSNEINQIFSRYEIPCFIDIKYPLSQALSASYLLQVIEVARFNYARDKVITLMKHPLFFTHGDSSRTFSDDIFKYENFIYKNNINYNLFFLENKGEGSEFEYIRKRILEVVSKLNFSSSISPPKVPKKKLDSSEYVTDKENEIDSLSLGEYLSEKETVSCEKAPRFGEIDGNRNLRGAGNRSGDSSSNVGVGASFGNSSDETEETSLSRSNALKDTKFSVSNEAEGASVCHLDALKDTKFSVSNETGETSLNHSDGLEKSRAKYATISEYIKVCKELIEEISDVLGNFLTMYRAEKYVKGEENVEEVNVRATKILYELLAVADDTIGEERVNLQIFEQYLKTLISQQSIAMLPRYLDSVYVGELLSSYIARPRAIFVIGASQDNLLSGVAKGGILNNKDTILMEKNLLPIYPSVKDRAIIEGFMFIDLMSKYVDKLYVGYSDNNLLGEPQKPSEAILEIASILDLQNISLSQKFSIDNAKSKEEIEDVAVSPANAYFTVVSNKNRLLDIARGTALSKVLSTIDNTLKREKRDKNSMSKKGQEQSNICLGQGNGKVYREREGYLGVNADVLHAEEKLLLEEDKLTSNLEEGITREDNYAQYFFSKDEEGNYKLSSSAIEAYYNCPYSFFLRYGLRIKEREIGEIAPIDIGNIIHEVLDTYFKEYAKVMGKINKVPKETYIKIAEDTINTVFSNIEKKEVYKRDPESVVKFENLRRECLDTLEDLTENVQRGNYVPTYFEQPFGMEGEKAYEIELEDGRKLQLIGKIDRVDTAVIGEEKRAIVIDYKTGGKDKGKIDKVFLGKEIQPFIYLMAIRSIKDNLIPAGALYLVISDSLTVKGKKTEFSGQIIMDETNFKNLDIEAYEEALKDGSVRVESSVLPFKIKMDKEGKVNSTSKLYPIEDIGKMDSMLSWVRDLIRNAFKDIDSGYFPKMPLKDGCKYCYMKEACTKANEEDFRKNISANTAKELFAIYDRNITNAVETKPLDENSEDTI